MFGKICFYGSLDILLLALKGFILSKLWVWFLVASLGVPAINLVTAMGIAIILSLLTTNIDYKSMENRTDGDVVINMITKAVWYLLVFGLSWVVHVTF